MNSWSDMKSAVAVQMSRDPQRATLSTRAWQAVEVGLTHLAQVGYGFEIAPRGTLAENQRLKTPMELPRPLSIADAVAQIQAPAVVDANRFEAVA